MKMTTTNMTPGIFVECTKGRTQLNFYKDNCIFRVVIEFSWYFGSKSDMMGLFDQNDL